MYSTVPLKYVSVTVTVAVYSPLSGDTHFDGPVDTDSRCAEAADGTMRNSARAATVLLTLRMATMVISPCGLFVEHITAAEIQLFRYFGGGRKRSFGPSVQSRFSTV